MKRPLKQLSLLILLVAAFSACQPKKDSVRANSNPYLTNNGILGNNLGYSSACVQGQTGQMGAIIDNVQPGTFNDRVRALLTATMSPQEVGTVGATLSDSTGVRFQGSVYLDANGNVNATNSNVKITIYDSIWLVDYQTNPSVDGIPLDFNPSQGATISGQFSNSTGQGYILLKDGYGEIRFDGTITAQSFAGNVTFRNYTNVTGQAAASGSLGQFTISCGFIRR